MDISKEEKKQCCLDAMKKAETAGETSITCTICNSLWEISGKKWEKGFDGLGLA